jgi:hypothetical protein
VAAIYLIGVLLTGFTFVLQKNYSGAGSVSMFSASVSYGMVWPVLVIKSLGRVIR